MKEQESKEQERKEKRTSRQFGDALQDGLALRILF
jgi:hypothetical protein